VTLQSLDGWVSQLRSLSGAIGEQGPALIEDVMASAINEAIAAGRSVDGYKWPPRVKDGAPAFAGGAKYVSIRRLNNVVLITLKGPMAFAQWGTGRMRARPLLPIRGLPFKLGNAIRDGIVDMGHDWMTRAGRHGKKRR